MSRGQSNRARWTLGKGTSAPPSFSRINPLYNQGSSLPSLLILKPDYAFQVSDHSWKERLRHYNKGRFTGALHNVVKRGEIHTFICRACSSLSGGSSKTHNLVYQVLTRKAAIEAIYNPSGALSDGRKPSTGDSVDLPSKVSEVWRFLPIKIADRLPRQNRADYRT